MNLLITHDTCRYTFFFKGGTANAPKVAVTNYLESIHKISSFQTVYIVTRCVRTKYYSTDFLRTLKIFRLKDFGKYMII